MAKQNLESSLELIKSHVEGINAHLAKYKVPARALQAGKAGDFICVNYAKGKPIIDLLAIILGKTAGAIISTVSAGLSSYCELDAIKNPTATDLKLKSKVIAKICATYEKFKSLLDLAILLLASQKEWVKALKGIQAAIETMCSTPAA